MSRAVIALHGDDHGPGGADATPVGFFWRVVPIAVELQVGDTIDIWNVPKDFDGLALVYIDGAVATVSSSGVVTVQLHNITQGVDMFTTRLTIDNGEKSSKTAFAPVEIDEANARVEWADEVRVDLDTIGTGTLGLALNLVFARPGA